MRTIRRQGLRALAALAVVAAVSGLGAAPASAGPCYIISVDGGPTATVCPLD